MKILVISNLYPPDVLGGYEMGCRQAADALRAAGHDVYVLTSVPRTKEVTVEAHVGRRLKLADIYDQYSMWKVSTTGRTIRNNEACGVQAFNVHILGQVIEEFQPDVVYAWNLIGLGGLGLLATIQHVGLPWVMHLMDDVPKTLCSLACGQQTVPALAAVFGRLCRGRFICCSQITLDEITTAGVPIADRTTLIPNWVTTQGTPNRTEYRRDGKLRLLTAGSICAHKGSHIVIQSAGLLRDRGCTNFEIDMYGMGTDPGFRTMIQSMRLDMVNIRGYRTQAELDAIYPTYDVMLLPTWEREPFGFAPLEAMAHGCLAVISRVCGISEWIVDRTDCIKTDRDPVALADAIQGILRRDIALEEIGRRGSRTVLQWFHMSAVLPRIVAELEAAIEAGGGPQRSHAEAYRIAQLAEKMFASLVHETAA